MLAASMTVVGSSDRGHSATAQLDGSPMKRRTSMGYSPQADRESFQLDECLGSC